MYDVQCGSAVSREACFLLAGSVFISCSELGGILGSVAAGLAADKLVATVSDFALFSSLATTTHVRSRRFSNYFLLYQFKSAVSD